MSKISGPSNLQRFSSIPGMLIFGTLSVVFGKLIYEISAKGENGKTHKFEKPWFTTDCAFLGMLLAIFVYWIEILFKKKCKKQNQKQLLNLNENENENENENLNENENENQNENLNQNENENLNQNENENLNENGSQKRKWKEYFYVFVPAICDVIATGIMSIGLIWIPASIWQMLRGSMVIFSAIFSVVFFKKKLYLYNWLGILSVCIALVMVGVSCIQSDTGNFNRRLEIIGIILVVASQIIQAAQIVIEEFLLKNVNMEPLFIVGLEGFWGFMVTSIICLPIVSVLPGNDGDGIRENTKDSFIMMGNSNGLTGLIIGYIFVILFYNIFGMLVTFTFTAVIRTILEALRTLCVWIVDLIIYYKISVYYGEKWTNWSYLEAGGFILLVLGLFIYKEVIRIPGLKYENGKKEIEENKLLGNENDNNREYEEKDNRKNKLDRKPLKETSNNKLDVSGMNLNKISQLTKNYTNLETLILSDNQIHKLPKQILREKTLISLNWSRNSLVKIPNTLYNLSNLTCLNLSQNQLTKISEKIKKLHKLTSLDLSINQLQSIPDRAFRELQNLTYLNLKRNKIDVIPVCLSKLKNLRELVLDANNIHETSLESAALSRLSVLKISHNQLKALPNQKVLINFSSLEFLDISHNSLGHIPDCISALKRLKILFAQHAHIGKISPELATLRYLARINLDNNNLENLPENFDRLSASLVNLHLNFNRFRNIPKSISNLTELRQLFISHNTIKTCDLRAEKLVDLDLSHNGLEKITGESLHSMSRLEYLCLNNNKLTTLPESLGDQMFLGVLKLETNSLSSLPDSIVKLQSLKELNLADNSLSELPTDFGRLAQLSSLGLHKNNLSSLPTSFSKLENLALLNLSSNSLVAFPEQILFLKNLERLDIACCCLAAFPENLDALSSLRELNACSNLLKSIPPSIGNLKNLHELHLSDNLLENLPPEFFRIGSGDVSSKIAVHISGNFLKTFDSGWFSIPNLVALDISHNEITSAPKDHFDKLPRLRSLKLSHNKMRDLNLKSTENLPFLHTLHIEGNYLSSDFITFLDSVLKESANLSEQSREHNFPRVFESAEISLTRSKTTSFANLNRAYPSLRSFLLSPLPVHFHNHSLHTNSQHYKVGYSEVKGRRPTMEDSIDIQTGCGPLANIDIYSIFDGHAGDSSSILASSLLASTILADLYEHLPHLIEKTKIFAEPNFSQKTQKMSQSTLDLMITKNKLNTAKFFSKKDDKELRKFSKKKNHLNFSSKLHSPHSHTRTNSNSSQDSSFSNETFSRSNSNDPLDTDLREIPQLDSSVEEDVKLREISAMFTRVFKTFHSHLKSIGDRSGTTALVSLFIDNDCYVANLGDSCAILSRKGKAIRISLDHKPFLPEEEIRIRKAGGYVSDDGRINGELAVSRSLGDIQFDDFLSRKPHVSHFRVTQDDSYLILICDGVSDILNDQEIVNIVNAAPSPYRAALRIRNLAYSNGSTDNISVIVVKLNPSKKSLKNPVNFYCLENSKIRSQSQKSLKTQPLIGEPEPPQKPKFKSRILSHEFKEIIPKKSTNFSLSKSFTDQNSKSNPKSTPKNNIEQENLDNEKNKKQIDPVEDSGWIDISPDFK
ncbi:s-cell enriched with leucine-rich repeat-containing protein slra-related [Anaeramoeba ignava]|uniref:S-cell enriched with leucine-rich repeat-containing protein slra-related n=1 Tax=Anaeramoeba ignava TaxID=1746090 RepID=A0A9Q0L8X2_ANAIG|nr:s-cell enriched with leucine-rich repeat-containing protein slra-related [Anaeramoeba ignava]